MSVEGLVDISDREQPELVSLVQFNNLNRKKRKDPHYDGSGEKKKVSNLATSFELVRRLQKPPKKMVGFIVGDFGSQEAKIWSCHVELRNLLESSGLPLSN